MELKIKELLQEKGLKMADLAARVGIDQSNLKKSLANNPKLSTLQDVAKALGVEVKELFSPSAPSRPAGIAVIGGKTYGMVETKVVQLPYYTDYSLLRQDVKTFVKDSVKGEGTGAFCGIVDGFEMVSLVYDKVDPKFILAIFFGNNQSKSYIYDKMEYAKWKNGKDSEPVWELDEMIGEIHRDIEGVVPSSYADHATPADKEGGE